MKKIVVALFTCMTLGSLGITALETSLPISQEPVPSKEVSVEKHCKRGPRGHMGHRGHNGHPGKQGEIGPQGPAGTSAVGEFGEAYLIPNWTGFPPAQFQIPFTSYAAVQFTAVGPLSSGVTYDSSTWTFMVNTAGTYSIEYSVKGSPFASGEPITLNVKVVLGGDDQVPTMVPFVIRSSEGYYAEAANQITRVLSAGTTIQLQAFCPSQLPGFMYGISGDSQEAAYISIEKIDE